jgi:hypothetical protein
MQEFGKQLVIASAQTACTLVAFYVGLRVGAKAIVAGENLIEKGSDFLSKKKAPVQAA